jgi:hypothetical protein
MDIEYIFGDFSLHVIPHLLVYNTSSNAVGLELVQRDLYVEPADPAFQATLENGFAVC